MNTPVRLRRSLLSAGAYNRIHVVDAACPDTAALLHKCGPEARIVGELRVGGEISARGAECQAAGAFFRVEHLPVFADKICRAVQLDAVNHDFNQITVPHSSYCTTRQRLGRNVSNACSGGNSAKAGIGQ
jgi:hypothetical protein